MPSKIIKHLCSYCGGFDVEVEDTGDYQPDTCSALVFNDTEEVTHVCLRCWKKVFDTVLGVQNREERKTT